VFLVMAVVLIVRPWGLFGKPEAAARRTPGLTVNPWRPLTSGERLMSIGALVVAATAAAVRRQLRAHRRLGDRDLRDLCRQPAFPDVGRRARLSSATPPISGLAPMASRSSQRRRGCR
jgi:hypothetical protein